MEKEGNVHPKNRCKLGLLVFLLLTGLLFGGCGDSAQPKPSSKKLRIGLMITPQGLNDMSFNDSAFNGLKSAVQKYGIESVLIEPSTMKDPEATLRFFAGQTFDAIIVVGVAFHKAIQTISKEHPQLPFFVIDSSLDEGNIKGISFREDEGSFLCGYLAAGMAKSQKIGFIGGLRNDIILRFFYGFRNGALYAASSTVVVDKFIAEDFSGFNRPKIAENIALEMYKDGCDVIYHAAGASGMGVISAAVSSKKYVIGVDKDQDSMAPGLVLTSMLKRVDLVVEDVVKTLAEGNGPESVKRTYGMKDGAIDLTEFQFSRQVLGDRLIKNVGELRANIISGKLSTGIVAESR